MRSRFTIILLVILAIVLWGCGSEDPKPDPDVSDNSASQANSAVEGLLSALYTISDHSLYEKLLEDMAKAQPSVGATGIYSFPAEVYDDFVALYSPYTTEDCIKKLFESREALDLRQLAYENGFTTEIDSISIQLSTAEEVEDTVSLAFDLCIKAKYENDGSESTAAVSGYVTVEETASGIFLVDYLRITGGSEIGEL